MKKENDEILELFRSRLENVEMPVRNTLWESLETEIPHLTQQRKLFIYRLTAVASVLLVLVGASAAFWYLSPQEEIADTFTQLVVSTNTTNGNIHSDGAIVKFPPIDETTAMAQTVTPYTSNAGYGTEDEEETVSVSISMSFSFSSSGGGEKVKSGNQISYAGGLDKESESVTKEDGNSAESISVKHIKTKNNSSGKWAIGLFAATSLNESKPSVKHHSPLSLGVSLQRKLTDKLVLESGLVYTQLKSEWNNQPTDQTLRSIGIPLKAKVSLHDSKQLDLYATAGGMVEKYLSGPTDACQASLLAGVGVECKLSNRLSLYAEPSATYHFDNGSSVPSLRKEKPLNLNLLCGVRMTY